ncbi:DNA adenine methylase [Nocardioides endophyticus]|uniref:DNA adenine methylase n=1 Tax=Nocardioides endophyticus TaxID=1353775 RepID=A0ABP8YAN5_9ACTN
MTTATASIRYMGTKEFLVPEIKQCVDDLPRHATRVVDLFAGSGAVASSMASERAVTCSDALGFVAGLLRARFLNPQTSGRDIELTQIMATAQDRAELRRRSSAASIRTEVKALDAGRALTSTLILGAKHPGNSSGKKAAATAARRDARYRLVEIYFARGYFSTAQAIELDALRYAIDLHLPADPEFGTQGWVKSTGRDYLLAIWILTAARLTNSPGHSAQFLRASTEAGFKRVSQNWRRSVFATFASIENAFSPVGDLTWRTKNSVLHSDALSLDPETVAQWNERTLIYADPPYTKDHYSRFYHLYETLWLYDYPEIAGAGRVRADRHLSRFCYRTKVRGAFDELCRTVLDSGASLLLSYPSSGLLPEDELISTLRARGRVAIHASVDRTHSSLGASGGVAGKLATERLYLVTP